MQARWTNAVIEFPLDRVRPSSGERNGQGGEVLIFTGVRIERMYDLAERLPPARTGHVSNARMDIDFW
ncbi:MAG: hypothetical protein NTZ54_07975 [Alphaproteobacteria bacterium]|uniref:hypothetical protein n=1 Tax=Aestuariivirga sp. TaxID=2650926 RepID=UPI00301B65EF|nr:hypothetical protein [Alphaproteobacteria bacterium]